MELSKFTSLKGVAKEYNISYHTLYSRLSSRGIKTKRFGIYILIPKKSVQILIKNFREE